MAGQTVNLSLPKELLARVDAAAAAEYASRSDFMRQALVERLRSIEATQPSSARPQVVRPVTHHGRPSALSRDC